MIAPKIPAGHQRVMPYFIVSDGDAFIHFLRQAFGAQEREVHRTPEGRVMHAEYTVGESVLMLGESNAEWPASTTMNYLYVTDVDATYRTCMNAGCKELYAPRDERYGVRAAGVKDPCGNTWWLAQLL